MPAVAPPTVDDATLILRLYELRRDEKLRAAREWFRTKCVPISVDEIKAIYATPGEENTNFRMMTTYWDMACSFVASGIIHPELFIQSAGESLLVWSRLEDFVPGVRREMEMPFFLANVEKMIAVTPSAPDRLVAMRKRAAAMREKRAKG